MLLLHAALLLEILMYSVLVLVQYPSFAEIENVHTLVYSNTCLDASRKAIEALIEVGKVSQDTFRGWAVILNTY